MAENLDLEEDIKKEVYACLEDGFGIYDVTIVYGKNLLKVKVSLDKLIDPWGTPNVSDCARFSRACDSRLMNLVEKGKMSDEYIIEVSSPGAERELRSLEEWVRFKEKPMKVRYRVSGDEINTIVAKYLRSENDMTYWRTITTKNDRKNKVKVKEIEVELPIQDITRVRLYLEF